MKPVLKYITLLIVSGVIIPLYQHTGANKTAPVIHSFNTVSANHSLVQDDFYHFAILRSPAAKLLPVLNFFQ